jgi:hypothetical protein
MDNIPLKIEPQISTDRSGGRFGGVCLSDHTAYLTGRVSTLPNHREGRSCSNKPDEIIEKVLIRVFGVVLMGEFFVDLNQFRANQLQPPLFKPRENLTNEPSLDSVRFDITNVRSS